ncbi:hypothetical protein QWY84_07840 [Aquisalimonas lutea]|uniref:hypothetical protein n=1 Tax=Aquisalimonas lutea TaxID=1327750 RepID=UPI0025B4B630|nr:hypothetical protein [Aquisalimonas lutea]MDN3517515.1 hypothetical protein [Aquisalimonas lutea]
MSGELDFSIEGEGPVAMEVRRRGFDRFLALGEHVARLPYGRPACSNDVLTVLKEQRGTCSSKHRLLAAVAQECGHVEVELVVGLYAMCEQNTPGIGTVLEPAGFDYIPEAHCYLRLGGRRYDFTGLSSGSTSPFEALLSEHVVSTVHLADEKERIHRDAVQRWADSHAVSFADAWALREACIQALTSSNTLKPTGSFSGATEPGV